MGNGPDLTTRQREVINLLPASSREIANTIGVTQSSVRDHIQSIRNKGVNIEWDSTSKA